MPALLLQPTRPCASPAGADLATDASSPFTRADAPPRGHFNFGAEGAVNLSRSVVATPDDLTPRIPVEDRPRDGETRRRGDRISSPSLPVSQSPSLGQDTDWQLAAALAATVREFLRLRDEAGYSARQAAFAVGKSPSAFSGEDSLLARFLRDGVAGL